MMRRLLQSLILLVALFSPLAAAFPQSPPAVPSLPDQERRTAYSIISSQCSCNVNFALFGTGTDVDSWLQVWVNGTRYLSTDPTFGWSLSSATGSLSTIPRPITDAVLTFNIQQTGTVQIVGAERPRQLTQFSENQGVPARALNQRFTDITAIERELWDKTSDLTGRGLFFAPGNSTGPMPLPSACANLFLAFDATGKNPLCKTPITNVTGNTASNVDAAGGTTVSNGTNGNCLNITLGAIGNAPCIDVGAANYYVATAGNGGSDSNDCKSAIVSGGHGPCLTLAHASSVALSLDVGGKTVTVNVGTGIFAGSFLISGPARGQGGANSTHAGYTIPYVQINGNGSANTIIDSISTDQSCGTLTETGQAYVLLTNLTIQESNAAPCGGASSAIFLQNLSYLALGPGVNFGPTNGQHMHAELASVIEITADYSISGSALNHEAVGTVSDISNDGHTVTCTGNFNFSGGFILSTLNGTVQFNPGTVFSGCSGTTGPKFVTNTGGTISGGGISSFFASLPGTTSGNVRSNRTTFDPMPAPSLTSCTNGTLTSGSTDDEATITFSGSSSTCTLLFAIPKFTNAVCSANSSGANFVSQVASTSGVLMNSTFANGNVLSVICRGLPS